MLARMLMLMVLARALYAQVLEVGRIAGAGLYLDMKAVSMDYDSIGDYGETATQRESPSFP